jgi:hypothetical protein
VSNSGSSFCYKEDRRYFNVKLEFDDAIFYIVDVLKKKVKKDYSYYNLLMANNINQINFMVQGLDFEPIISL